MLFSRRGYFSVIETWTCLLSRKILLQYKEIIRRQFNNEVQHLGQQKGSCYPKCLWENTTDRLPWMSGKS